MGASVTIAVCTLCVFACSATQWHRVQVQQARVDVRSICARCDLQNPPRKLIWARQVHMLFVVRAHTHMYPACICASVRMCSSVGYNHRLRKRQRRYLYIIPLNFSPHQSTVRGGLSAGTHYALFLGTQTLFFGLLVSTAIALNNV